MSDYNELLISQAGGDEHPKERKIMTTIQREDIQAGDYIRVTTFDHGVMVERTGKVESPKGVHKSILTEEGGYIWDCTDLGKHSFDLIDRPKPPLPTSTGAVVIATKVAGWMSAYAHMFLRPDGRWEVIGTGETVKPQDIYQWKLAKIIEVDAW